MSVYLVFQERETIKCIGKSSEMIHFCQLRYRRWGTLPGIRERKNSSEMNVSDLTINLCESQLTTLKNKKVVAFQKYTADRRKKSKLGWFIYIERFPHDLSQWAGTPVAIPITYACSTRAQSAPCNLLHFFVNLNQNCWYTVDLAYRLDVLRIKSNNFNKDFPNLLQLYMGPPTKVTTSLIL